MSFELAIHPDAEREWRKLDEGIRQRFKSKLAKERLEQPRVAKDALRGLPDFYKIKITTPQNRVAFHVDERKRVVTIMAVSSRDEVYELLKVRQTGKRS